MKFRVGQIIEKDEASLFTQVMSRPPSMPKLVTKRFEVVNVEDAITIKELVSGKLEKHYPEKLEKMPGFKLDVTDTANNLMKRASSGS